MVSKKKICNLCKKTSRRFITIIASIITFAIQRYFLSHKIIKRFCELYKNKYMLNFFLFSVTSLMLNKGTKKVTLFFLILKVF